MEPEQSLEFEFKLRLASAIAQGQTYTELNKKFDMTYTQLRRYKNDPAFNELVMELVEDERRAAFFTLIQSSKKAVQELVRFLGNPDIDERTELTAIDIILKLSVGVTASTKSQVKTSLAGHDKKSIEAIRQEFINGI